MPWIDYGGYGCSHMTRTKQNQQELPMVTLTMVNGEVQVELVPVPIETPLFHSPPQLMAPSQIQTPTSPFSPPPQQPPNNNNIMSSQLNNHSQYIYQSQQQQQYNHQSYSNVHSHNMMMDQENSNMNDIQQLEQQMKLMSTKN